MDVAYELKNYSGIRFELSGTGNDYCYRKKNALVKVIIVFRKEMEITHGTIEPGVGIGNFKINMSKDELLDKIGPFYNMFSNNIIEVGNAIFRLDENDKVETIAVEKGFEGKFLEHIVRGFTLMDIQKYGGDYFEDYDTYGLKDYKGIRFELGEQGDDYDELKAPIDTFIVLREGDRIEGGTIEAGVGIGDFKINMSKEELLEKIGPIYKIHEGKNLEIGNATFWLDDNDKVCKIAVVKVYGGKFLEYIGMGSTLMDVQKYAGEFYKNGATYELKEYPGIYFGIGEEGYDYNYDEMKAPICVITVFRKEKILQNREKRKGLEPQKAVAYIPDFKVNKLNDYKHGKYVYEEVCENCSCRRMLVRLRAKPGIRKIKYLHIKTVVKGGKGIESVYGVSAPLYRELINEGFRETDFAEIGESGAGETFAYAFYPRMTVEINSERYHFTKCDMCGNTYGSKKEGNQGEGIFVDRENVPDFSISDVWASRQYVLGNRLVLVSPKMYAKIIKKVKNARFIPVYMK